MYKFNRPFCRRLPTGEWITLDHVHFSAFWVEIEKRASANYTIYRRDDCVNTVATANNRDVVKEYIDSYKIDPSCPYQSFAELGTAWGLEPNPNTEFGLSLPFKTCLALQRRGEFNVRTTLVLLGAAGVGKSTYVSQMLPEHLRGRYFTDSVYLDISAKARLEATRRQAILEMSEMQGASKADWKRLRRS